MGNQQISIQIDDNVLYIGQADSQGKAHGKGQLTINKESDSYKCIAKFQYGNLTYIQLNNGNITYEGEVKNGNFSGQGKLKISNDAVYSGTFQQGKLIKGSVSKMQKYQCQGQYQVKSHSLNGQNCEYKFLDYHEILEGSFLDGNINGKGTYQFYNNDKYYGNFLSGQLEGLGQYISSLQGFSFKGKFKKSIPGGGEEGQICFNNGDHYQGQIKEGYMHGQGKYTFKDGNEYIGTFFRSQMTGQAQIQYKNNSEVEAYKGEVLQGMYNGLGIIHYSNGLIYKGYFYQNMKNGPAVIIYGKKMYKCLYIMNKLIGEPQQVISNF